MSKITTARVLAVVCFASLGAVGCSSEEAIDASDVDTSGHIGSVEQAGSTGDSPDYVYLGSAWGYRRWSSVGLHKIQCMWTGNGYRASYQGWSNESHCTNNLRATWLPTCSGSGVWNHNTDHDGSDHWFNNAGASHDGANTHEGSCSYSWWSTCNSKDWVEHFVDPGQPYWEDGH